MDIEKIKGQYFLSHLNSKEELKNWVYTYLGILLPFGCVSEDSNGAPGDAIWEAYKTYKEDLYIENPGYIWLANRDGAKCVKKGTFLTTKNGFLKPIEDIKIGEMIWTGWNWQRVSAWIDDGVKKSYTANIEGGWSITGSEIHRVWSIKKDRVGWERISNLKEGDYVAVNGSDISDFSLDQEKYDIGYVLGILQGDGCLTLMDKYRTVILSCSDPHVQKTWSDFVFKKTGKRPHYNKAQENKKCKDLRVASKDLCDFLKSLGLKNCYSWEKEVPSFCLDNKSAFIGFAAGLFDTDGTHAASPSFVLTAYKMLEQMQKGFMALGVYSNLRKVNKLRSGQRHAPHYLTIPNHEMNKLYDLGYSPKVKKDSVEKKATKIPDAHDSVPSSLISDVIKTMPTRYGSHRGCGFKKGTLVYCLKSYPTISRDKVKTYIKWCEDIGLGDRPEVSELRAIVMHRWKKISSIDISEHHFYDLTVSGDHSYWSDGIISHNTLSGSILNVLLLFHFKAEIAHFAAVKKQAEKCIEYTNIFVRKVTPYLEQHGRKVIGDAKTKIQILNEDSTVSFIDVITATLAGGNSQRTSMASYDELDTLSPVGLVGYKEAKLIPTRKFDRGPLTVKYSTRKFSFGIFEKEIQDREDSGEKLIQWNLIDLTEKCQDSRSLKNKKTKYIRYVKKELPPKMLNQNEFDLKTALEKTDYQKIEIYEGCLKCPLAVMCRSKLADRDPIAQSLPYSLYKTIDFTIGQFKKLNKSPEMAEAQLMNWRPASTGLVYPKISSTNFITLEEAYEKIVGNTIALIGYDDLVRVFKDNGCVFYGGVDFGFSKEAALVIVGVFPNGLSFLMDSFGSPGLEAHEFAEAAVPYQEKYGIKSWYCDQAMPSSIKTFKKAVGSACPAFTKDVLAGVEALRSRIVTALGARMFFVLKTKDNEFIIEGLKKHHFELDAAGNPTKKIAEDDFDDRLDALRYVAQNIFGPKGIAPTAATSQDRPLEGVLTQEQLRERVAELNRRVMAAKIKENIPPDDAPLTGEGEPKKKGVFWTL